jgi:LysM repeat protein
VRTVNRSSVVIAAVAALALVGAHEPLAAQAPCQGHHTVRDGDSLAAIAARCGVTLPALLAANGGITADEDLRIGGVLRIPDPRAPQPSPQQACGGFYTVRSGDTLASVARKCGVTVPLLVAANAPLEEPLWLQAGGQIRIPNLPRTAVDDTLTWAAATPAMDVDPELENLERIQGALAAGSPCMLLHAADGRTFALIGDPDRRLFSPGQTVVVLGVPTSPEQCDHSPTLDLRIIYRAAPDAPHP